MLIFHPILKISIEFHSKLHNAFFSILSFKSIINQYMPDGF